MPLLKNLFMKPSSTSDWVRWDGKTAVADGLYSLGLTYVKVIKVKGHWRIFYRMGNDRLEMPPFFKTKFPDEEALCRGLDMFADWAYDNQIRLLEAHERHCDGEMD